MKTGVWLNMPERRKPIIRAIKKLPNPYPDTHGVALDEDARIQTGMHRGYEQARADILKLINE